MHFSLTLLYHATNGMEECQLVLCYLSFIYLFVIGYWTKYRLVAVARCFTRNLGEVPNKKYVLKLMQDTFIIINIVVVDSNR